MNGIGRIIQYNEVEGGIYALIEGEIKEALSHGFCRVIFTNTCCIGYYNHGQRQGKTILMSPIEKGYTKPILEIVEGI